MVNIKEPFKSTYRILGYNARKRGIENTLTFEEFLLFTEIGICFYCGGPITWNERGRAGRTNLDRKDNSKGYFFENIAVTCKKCNSLKSNFFKSEEFKAVMKVHEIWENGSVEDRKDLWDYLLSWQDQYVEIEK